nr:aldo/keto reductase [uncultured Cellulosilyticum sp.]
MKKMRLGTSNLEVPVVAIGCMRMNQLDEKGLADYIVQCMEKGLNFFDHADIYGAEECEEKFSVALRQAGIKREDVILQSKCGICPGKMYDLSKEHILESVEGILKRLNTEYIDVLALHRPDTLVEPEEVAAAFDILQNSGKVRHFGVSNYRPMQIELLKKYVKQDLIVNQMQFSAAFSTMIASELEANMLTEGAVDRDGGVLNYCRIHEMTMQAWSPFQYGFFEGVYIGSDKYPDLNLYLEELAKKYDTTPTAIATAWILRHPARIQMVAGTTNIQRINEIVAGTEVTLSKEEWYKLYMNAGHILP